MKNITYLNYLSLSTFLLFLTFSCKQSTEQAAETAPVLPNVVLLLGDDHGWDETGYNGHPYLNTPVLDEMAATGLRMDRFYSASPVCSPTRGSIITGRHPNRYGTFTPGYSIRPEEISIASLMQEAGYATAHYGKWHLGPVKASSPTNPAAMGFQEYLSHDNFFEMNPPLSDNGAEPVIFQGESSEILVREAQQFMDQALEQGKPFFVVIWYGSPHEPYSGLPEDLALYEDLPEDFGDRMVRLTSNETGAPVERLQREVLQERFAEITAMDRSIGQLRNYLSEKGQRDNTLLWYFGDNGTPQEGNATVPFREQKGSVYEGGIRVPAVLEWPAKLSQALVSDASLVSSDVLSTLCSLVGIPLPERPLDGLDISPVFEGKMDQRPEPIGFWNGRPRSGGEDLEPYIAAELQTGTTPLVKLMNGIATRNFRNYRHPDIEEEDFAGDRAWLDYPYKLVIHGKTGEDTKRELFDLSTDPAEEHNLYADQPERVGTMEQELRNWQQSVLESLTGADY
ncbi:sulfatase family protein [Cyclobacterium xiamenense]|uniref:sulfatase family protein n=1 Tax=Cyclobacterium xiamenense TaxID=1297121 RepID=UPI0012B87B32|nr:sulfatase-like hydrolase/transferase [Cyclobacterium xiamenense]